MKTEVPIVFATDDRFARYCSISLASLIRNRDRDRKYSIFILYDELEEEHKKKLSSMATDNVSVEMINISEYIDSKLLYIHSRQSLATYYRFFVSDVLPQYDKILYLDSDIAILKDIGELYDIEIGNSLLGGVVMYRGHEHEKRNKEEYLEKTLGIKPEQYINAGILIMNLSEFRKKNIKEACLDYLRINPKPRWMDQDVLNAVCKEAIEYIPERWNMSQFYYNDDFYMQKDLSYVGVIHYIDRKKPGWVAFLPAHLFAYSYAAYTPYADELRMEFLDAQLKDTKDYKREFLLMSERCDIGPRFFTRASVLWAKGKISKITGDKQ